MKILVTGASGFIGKYVVNKLIDKKYDLRLFVRDPGKINLSKGPFGSEQFCGNGNQDIKICKGDLTDKESVFSAVKGCDTVLHLGAIATKWERNPEIYFKVNYTGTKYIFDACLENNVKKVVYTSTSLSPSLRNKSLNTLAGLPEYVKSKIATEQLAETYINKGLDISIVYPTRVFGPGELNDANSATQVIDKYLRNKFPFILNGGKNTANWAFVKDVAEGIILTAQKGKCGKKYILGGENIEDNLFLNLLNKISGKKHLRISLSYSAALGIAYCMDFTSSIFKYKPLITPCWLKSLSENNSYSIAETISDLGYKITPLEEALRETVNWLNDRESEITSFH